MLIGLKLFTRAVLNVPRTSLQLSFQQLTKFSSEKNLTSLLNRRRF